MERELSNSYRGKYAYTLTKLEKTLIAKALRRTLKDYDRKIERVENNPRNEGQVTFQDKIIDLRATKVIVNDIINEFS